MKGSALRINLESDVGEDAQTVKPTLNAINTFDSGIKNIIDIKVGDDKETNFMPRMKALKWNNECNFSIGLENLGGDYTKIDNKIVYNKGDVTANFYPKSRAFDIGKLNSFLLDSDFVNIAGTECKGAFEFDVVLAKKPKVSYVDFTIKSKQVSFHKQFGSEGPNDIVPINVQESIALYHLQKKNGYVLGQKNYGCGKVGHLYRPFIYDVDGNWAWGGIQLIGKNKVAQKLRVTIPEVFYNKAKYPITIDPTFGYTVVGASAIFVCTEDVGGILVQDGGDYYKINNAGIPIEYTWYVTVSSDRQNQQAANMYYNIETLVKNAESKVVELTWEYGKALSKWYTEPIKEQPVTPIKPGDKRDLAIWSFEVTEKNFYVIMYFDNVGAGNAYAYQKTWIHDIRLEEWYTGLIWTNEFNGRLFTIFTTYRLMEEQEVLNIKTAEEVVLGTYHLPEGLTDVELVLLNATSGGISIGDDITNSYLAGTSEVWTITCVVFASVGQADHFYLINPLDGQSYCFWFDKDGNGTEPTSSEYLMADNQIEMDIVTGNNAEDVGDEIVNHVDAIDGFTAVNTAGSVAITCDKEATVPDAESYNSGATLSGGCTIGTTIPGASDAVAIESHHMSGYYFIDMDDFTVQPSIDTELFYFFRSLIEGLASPPQRLIVGKQADDINDILTDTNELQIDWTSGGRLDLILGTIVGLSQENQYSDQLVYNGSGNVISGRIRIYSVAGSVGTDNDVLATYTVTVEWNGNSMSSYKVVKQ